jgi:hypothetical protein
MKERIYNLMKKYRKVTVALFVFGVIQGILITSHGGFYAAMLLLDAAPESCQEVSSWCYEAGPVVIYDIDTKEMYPVHGLNMTGIEFQRLMPRLHEKMAEEDNRILFLLWEPYDDIFYRVVLITRTGGIEAAEAVKMLDDPELNELLL